MKTEMEIFVSIFILIKI